MTSNPGQSIEAFAELMARLDDPFSDRAEVLRRAALDERALQRLEERFAKELAAESEEPARRFGDAYEATVRALAAVRGDDEAAPDLRFLNADAQPFREEAAAVLREPVAAPVAAAPVEPRAEAPAPVPAVRSVDVAWVPEGMRGFTDLRSTQLAPNTDAPRGPALPFNPNAAPTLSAQPSAARAPFVPEGMRSFTSVHGTQLADGGSGKPALPFPGADRSEATIPARGAAPVGNFPQLSVEQYASLHVELAALPGRSTEVLDRYRITEDQRRRLDAHWTARMAADPALRQAWDGACAAYKAWLARSKGER